MRRFCLQNVESILEDTKKDLPKRTGPFHYIREFNYSSTAACAAAKFSLFIRVLRMRCKLFASSFLYVTSFLYFCCMRTKLLKITDMA